MSRGSTLTIIGLILTGITVYQGFLPTNTAQTTGDNSPAIVGNNARIEYTDTPDPSYLNERDANLKNLDSKELVATFFKLYNEGQFRKACSLFKQSKCDIRNGSDLENFSREYEKQLNGYEDISLWKSHAAFTSEVICVKYKYQYKADANPADTWEIFSFYISSREDGIKEITSRVCEKKFKDGSGERGCPQKAAREFCI